jgi:hypothetical protein
MGLANPAVDAVSGNQEHISRDLPLGCTPPALCPRHLSDGGKPGAQAGPVLGLFTVAGFAAASFVVQSQASALGFHVGNRVRALCRL